MNIWNPLLLKQLIIIIKSYSNIFDNRGIENTISGEKGFSIVQFVNDIVSLLYLDIHKIRWSNRGTIRRELKSSDNESDRWKKALEK